MEYDTQKAARVWQRVQGEKQEAQRSDNPAALIMEQLQLSAVYQQLSRQISGREGARFMRLAREAREQAVCLKGILIFMTGQSSAISAPMPEYATRDAMLRSCYGRELRLQKLYESRADDPEYGPAYGHMARRGQAHCCELLELAGILSRPQGQ